MSDISDRYDRLASDFADTISKVPETGWSSPSPCEGWDAREIVRHVLGAHATFRGFVDRPLDDGPRADDDPAAAFAHVRRQVHDDLVDPDRAQAEFDGFTGRSTFEQGIDRFICADLLVHRWDLATAAGLSVDLPEAEAERVLELLKAMPAEMLRSPGAFGPEVPVPEDAPVQDRLLGFLGRDPSRSA